MAGKGNPNWKPGCKSANPGGRPKKSSELAEACRELTPDVLRRLEQALSDASWKARLEACKIILERGYGKAQQSVTLTGADGGPVAIAVDAARAQLAEILGRGAK